MNLNYLKSLFSIIIEYCSHRFFKWNTSFDLIVNSLIYTKLKFKKKTNINSIILEWGDIFRLKIVWFRELECVKAKIIRLILKFSNSNYRMWSLKNILIFWEIIIFQIETPLEPQIRKSLCLKMEHLMFHVKSGTLW